MALHTGGKRGRAKSLGFTIIELLIVIVVIGVLATLVLVRYVGTADKARLSVLQSDLTTISKSLDIYQANSATGSYPSSLAALNNTTTDTKGTTFTYTQGSPVDDSTFCLYGINGKYKYYVTNTVRTPTAGDGTCPAVPPSTPPSTPPSGVLAGITAWWPFNGDAVDQTGNGNDGTVNGATLTTGQNTTANGAYAFNGSSAYITTNKPILNGLTTFSYGGWMYYSAGQATQAGFAGQNDNVENFFVNGTDSRFYVAGATTTCVYLASSTWHMIYITFDGTTTRQYADGVQCDSSASSSHPSSSSSFNIGGGGIADPSGNYFKGSIDDVRIYNRGLTSTEIQTLYTQGAQ